MKNVVLTLLGVAVLAFSSASYAGTVSYFDIDHIGTKLSKKGKSSLTGTFDVTASGIEGDSYTIGLPYFLVPQTFSDQGGFVPGQSSVVSATVYFAVRDDQILDWKEYLEVEIEDISQGSFNVSVNIASYDVEASLMGNLDATGRLNYHLKSTKGDFIVDYAAIEVMTNSSFDDNPQIVPLPAATWAGGSLLLGLAVIRKMRNK